MVMGDPPPGVMSKALRRRVRQKLLHLASASSVVLPRPLVLGGLQGAAWLSRFSAFEDRTLANLELAFGQEFDENRRQRIAAGVRRHVARLSYEWLQLASIGDERDEWLAGLVEVDDSIELLREQLAAGRGAIVITAHIGNWELLAATLHRIGFEGAVVGYEKRRDPSATWLVDMRRSYGVRTIPQHSHPRALVRELEEGHLLGLLCDLEVRRLAGVHLDFLGTPALTMTAPAALARVRRTPLIPVRCVLPEEGAPRYRLLVEEPLEYDASLPRAEATSELMQRANNVFMSWIREHPAQWAWHQPRWRTKPGELASIPLAGR
jgi:KDO2-lipid IV(A) lauroyltransferase